MTAVDSALDGSGPQARARMIECHLPLVRRIARRFAGRGETYDDLVQVGNVALICAVDRCDPARARQFASYAAVCVEGEIKRHLRDRCDPLRVPRHLHSDTALMALVRAPAPIDVEADASLGEPAMDDVGLARALVASAARGLDARERRVVALRFFLDLSQNEIADAVGISQVHVSRVLQEALRKMRVSLAPGGAATIETARRGLGSESRERRQAVHGV